MIGTELENITVLHQNFDRTLARNNKQAETYWLINALFLPLCLVDPRRLELLASRVRYFLSGFLAVPFESVVL